MRVFSRKITAPPSSIKVTISPDENFGSCNSAVEVKSPSDFEMQTTKNIKITVCGQTGAGKSTLCNGILGAEVFKSKNSFDPVTNEIQKSHFDWTDGTTKCKLTVLDTPGFNDGSGKEEEHIESIRRQCKDSNLLLYCIPSSLPVLPKDKEALIKLKEILGESANKVVVVLTNADKVVNERKELNDIKCTYNSDIQAKADKMDRALQEVFQNTAVPIVPTSKLPTKKIIRGDKVNLPWLAQLFHQVLEDIDEISLFPMLVRSHPHLRNENNITVQDIAKRDRFLINAQASPTHVSVGKSIAGVSVGGAVAGLTGAGVGATIGALAIGAPTFGVAAGAGLVIGGAIGGAIGLAVGTGGAVAVSKTQKNKQ